jgi:hypothetical protein
MPTTATAERRMRGLIVAICIVLAGCVAAPSPGPVASCEAAAINASNQVVVPPDAYAAVAARQRQRETFEVNLEACLAQHGYKLVPEKMGK